MQLWDSWADRRAGLGSGRRWFATTTGVPHTRYDSVEYRTGDVVAFGCESDGLGEALLAEFPGERRLHIPMRPSNRSMNLANAVSVVVYEAWRQHDFAAPRPARSRSPCAAPAGSDPEPSWPPLRNRGPSGLLFPLDTRSPERGTWDRPTACIYGGPSGAAHGRDLRMISDVDRPAVEPIDERPPARDARAVRPGPSPRSSSEPWLPSIPAGLVPTGPLRWTVIAVTTGLVLVALVRRPVVIPCGHDRVCGSRCSACCCSRRSGPSTRWTRGSARPTVDLACSRGSHSRHSFWPAMPARRGLPPGSCCAPGRDRFARARCLERGPSCSATHRSGSSSPTSRRRRPVRAARVPRRRVPAPRPAQCRGRARPGRARGRGAAPAHSARPRHSSRSPRSQTRACLGRRRGCRRRAC